MSPTEQEILHLRTALKRCSAETIDAAIRFRTTGDIGAVPAIVYGIIERHLAPENARSLATVPESTRLIEDLGVDSLTLLEIVLSIEETVNISIENEELREIRTLGEVKDFIGRKLSGKQDDAGTSAGPKVRRFNREDIRQRLPQQPPFLFLDEAEIDGQIVRATYTVKGDEFFLEGHFKNNPIMPASIVFEAIGQAACLWVLECAPDQLHTAVSSEEVLFASMEEAHFYRRAKPGDLLTLEAEMVRLRAPLAKFRGSAKLHGERLAQIENLSLAFGQEVVEHLVHKEEHDRHEEQLAAVGAGAATVSHPQHAGTEARREIPIPARRIFWGLPQ